MPRIRMPLQYAASRNLRHHAKAILVFLTACAFTAACSSPLRTELTKTASTRQTPLIIHQPQAQRCNPSCPVAIFGTGYQVAAEEYSYIGNALAEAGYLVIVLQYDLPGDPVMPDTGNIRKDREAFWLRGESALEAALNELPTRLPHYDWHNLTIMGHSQGGDIAALYAATHSDRITALITLDHRRVPLLRNAPFRTLTLRSSDQTADPGVLPPPGDAACILKLPDTRHDDMTDRGSKPSRQMLLSAILQFLKTHECPL